MDTNVLTEQLVADGPYSRLDHVASTGSTNADLLGDPDAPAWAVRLAEHQSAGRGRLGRAWGAPSGSQLIASVLLRPSGLDHVGTLPLAAGVALTDVLPRTSLKWPNDLQIQGRKLCGILAEANFAPTPVIVIGFGLNVSLGRTELPVAHATSLALEGIEADRTRLAVQVLRAVHNRLVQWENGDPALISDYRAVSATLGQQVRVELPGQPDLHGEATDVLADGRLRVRARDGSAHELSAGDVTHLRLA